MFKRILMACDGSAESGPALHTGIHLAKALNAELRAVSVQEKLPVYATYVDVGMPGGTVILRQDTATYYRELQAIGQQTTVREGIKGRKCRRLWNVCSGPEATCW
jgi:nucleotide-binding universal stress UspA family protein